MRPSSAIPTGCLSSDTGSGRASVGRKKAKAETESPTSVAFSWRCCCHSLLGFALRIALASINPSAARIYLDLIAVVAFEIVIKFFKSHLQCFVYLLPPWGGAGSALVTIPLLPTTEPLMCSRYSNN